MVGVGSRGIVDEMFVLRQGGVSFAAVKVGVYKEVIGDDVGVNAGLFDEAVEGE